MAASRHRHLGRRTATAATATAVALSALTGCDAMNKALDCVQTADAIADSATDLQQAVQNASDDPTRTGQALRSIERNLKTIGDKTDDADVNKAVDDLGEAVRGVRTAVRDGDHTPDAGPVTDAAGELTKVCTT